ncbi:PF07600 family protein [Leptospira weilii str. 2006001853]|uniref:PF07600 family protein n=1 Tax=Leptospira weilii str. 2006001853 TaxID=1001589 RepID=A0A828YY36_9LEPT|nr:PF07600 family protein [Leptospira weilii str. 2006001853]
MKRLHCKAGKIKYNRGVGKMKKFSIRVNTGTWAILGALAAAHGVSRCYLFNYMLWLEDVGVGDSIVETLNRGVPSFHGTYRMIWTLDLRQNLISRELEFKPNPMTERGLVTKKCTPFLPRIEVKGENERKKKIFP